MKVPRSIGTRLTLAVSLVFTVYLMAASTIGYLMYQQYHTFRQLAGGHFERALQAAELTRHAEVIAAEVFEVMVSGERSLNTGSRRTDNLMQLYQSSRLRLDNGLAADDPMRQQLDRWQAPFFSSLGALDERLTREQQLQGLHLRRIDRLFLLLRDWPAPADWVNLPQHRQAFFSQALLAVAHAGTALNAERPGQLAQLRQRVDEALQTLEHLPLDSAEPALQRQTLTGLLSELLDAHDTLLRSQRATLAQARQTRVLAQQLTGASFRYHEQFKQAAHDAIDAHETLISRSLLALALLAAGLLAVTALAVLYIRRTLVMRILDLNTAMQAHLDGHQATIPEQGRDEIATMGATFAYFVKARQHAERRLAEANHHLQQANAELEQLSCTDAMTGIANRRRFERALSSEWARARRNRTSLALIMVDVDYFKGFNDHYGHPEGDLCLYRVAQALSHGLKREGDLVARYGGEEFVVLLPGLDAHQAEQLATQLCSAVRALAIPHQTSSHTVVTISAGVAALTPTADMTAEQLVNRADTALYAAKAGGRNRARIATDPVQPATSTVSDR